jgi:hypothetical protein
MAAGPRHVAERDGAGANVCFIRRLPVLARVLLYAGTTLLRNESSARLGDPNFLVHL